MRPQGGVDGWGNNEKRGREGGSERRREKGTSGQRIVLALSIMVIANLAIIEVGNSFLLSHFIDQPETELSIMLIWFMQTN